MNSKKFFILFLLSINMVSVAQKTAKNQQFVITSNKGTNELWSKDEKKWVQFQDLNELKSGTTIATRENSELQITFEPAIFFTLKKNSLLSLNNLLIQKDTKIIRMFLNLQKGDAIIKIQSLSGYTLLLSLETPSATLSMSTADAEFSVNDNSTSFQVLRGEIRVKHTVYDLQSIVFEGSKARTQIDRASIEITGAKESPPSNVKITGPSIAILSVQSDIKHDKNTDAISDVVADYYQKQSNARVLYLDDIRELLRSEKGENLLNCFSDSCIAKLSSLVGVDIVILGNLGQIGDKFLFSLKMIDVLRNKTLKRLTTNVDSDPGRIVDKIPEMVGELVQTQKSTHPIQQSTKYSSTDTASIKKVNEDIVWIPGGTFQMGMKTSEEYDALPIHNVTLNGFYIDRYEVTKESYEQVTGSNPSSFRGCNTCPADNVTWQEAQDYCKKVGKRLPTEAEWEYACRAGSDAFFHYGNTLSSEQANFDGTKPFGGVPIGAFKGRPVPVSTYQPNSWGLYDMHGNVAEWCADWYSTSFYGNGINTNPTGPSEGTLKVVRGGSWNNSALSLRSGKRAAYNPTIRLNTIGFRCVKDDYEKR